MARIGLTAEQFIRDLDYNKINELKRLSPKSQATLKATDERTLKKKDREFFTGWIGQSIPPRDPDGKCFSNNERAELAEFCWQCRSEFRVACPSRAVEDAVTTDRTNDRKRKPTESDGPDLMHITVGMAYCDIFLTRDKYQAQNARNAIKKLNKIPLAKLCTDPGNLSALVDAMPD